MSVTGGGGGGDEVTTTEPPVAFATASVVVSRESDGRCDPDQQRLQQQQQQQRQQLITTTTIPSVDGAAAIGRSWTLDTIASHGVTDRTPLLDRQVTFEDEDGGDRVVGCCADGGVDGGTAACVAVDE